MDDPIACCEKCGVVPPASVALDVPGVDGGGGGVPHGASEHDLRSPTLTSTANTENMIVSARTNGRSRTHTHTHTHTHI